MESFSISQRLLRILLYNDTRFYELLVGFTSITLSLVLTFFGNIYTAPTLIVVYEFIYPYWWGVFFLVSGILQATGSIMKADKYRLIGNGMGLLLYAFWGVAALHVKSVFWPLLAFMAIKIAWVIFRILIDKNRPEKGEII